ncbi:MAG: IS200/IS605 family transposase [Gemmatimonadetes bacterium]|nr:IS200/IS605 family transposase [Gemmatimonadota bacterium]
MPGTYSQILLHIVFSTKHREPWITLDLAERLYPYIGGIVRAEKGVPYDIGGVEDHIHMYLRWWPGATISDLMRTVKTRSSKWVHNTFPALGPFAWQEGYSVFTVSKSQEEAVKEYITGQAEQGVHAFSGGQGVGFRGLGGGDAAFLAAEFPVGIPGQARQVQRAQVGQERQASFAPGHARALHALRHHLFARALDRPRADRPALRAVARIVGVRQLPVEVLQQGRGGGLKRGPPVRRQRRCRIGAPGRRDRGVVLDQRRPQRDAALVPRHVLEPLAQRRGRQGVLRVHGPRPLGDVLEQVVEVQHLRDAGQVLLGVVGHPARAVAHEHAVPDALVQAQAHATVHQPAGGLHHLIVRAHHRVQRGLLAGPVFQAQHAHFAVLATAGYPHRRAHAVELQHAQRRGLALPVGQGRRHARRAVLPALQVAAHGLAHRADGRGRGLDAVGIREVPGGALVGPLRRCGHDARLRAGAEGVRRDAQAALSRAPTLATPAAANVDALEFDQPHQRAKGLRLAALVLDLAVTARTAFRGGRMLCFPLVDALLGQLGVHGFAQAQPVVAETLFTGGEQTGIAGVQGGGQTIENGLLQQRHQVAPERIPRERKFRNVGHRKLRGKRKHFTPNLPFLTSRLHERAHAPGEGLPAGFLFTFRAACA